MFILTWSHSQITGNQISIVPVVLADLPNLETLCLDGLFDFISSFDKTGNLLLKDLPQELKYNGIFEDYSEEDSKESKENMKRFLGYLGELKKARVHVKRCKVIIVGEGFHGKARIGLCL